jgi:hypothetical protein
MKANAKFINTEKIEGYVYSLGNGFGELQERVSGENSKNPGTKYIAGDLNIAVDEAGLNVITIHYTYVTETYSNGKTNNTYSALKKIIEAPEKFWVNGGKDNALKVQCTGVSIAVNDFIAGDGKKVAALRNENGFCSIVNELKPEAERTRFDADFLITGVTHVEADPENNIEKDFVSVKGAIFGYGPKIIPASFVVYNDMGMKYFEDLDATNAQPFFTKVWGYINCKTIETQRVEESAFGEPSVQTSTRKTREYVITGTAKVPYDFGDEEVLTVEDISKMNTDRQTLLAEVEKRYNERQAQKPATATPAAAEAPVKEGNWTF